MTKPCAIFIGTRIFCYFTMDESGAQHGSGRGVVERASQLSPQMSAASAITVEGACFLF
jgi:hypothetical protein